MSERGIGDLHDQARNSSFHGIWRLRRRGTGATECDDAGVGPAAAELQTGKWIEVFS